MVRRWVGCFSPDANSTLFPQLIKTFFFSFHLKGSKRTREYNHLFYNPYQPVEDGFKSILVTFFSKMRTRLYKIINTLRSDAKESVSIYEHIIQYNIDCTILRRRKKLYLTCHIAKYWRPLTLVKVKFSSTNRRKRNNKNILATRRNSLQHQFDKSFTQEPPELSTRVSVPVKTKIIQRRKTTKRGGNRSETKTAQRSLELVLVYNVR